MEDSAEQLHRVRRICTALPKTTERLSHGEPTFFVRKKVYAMFANQHNEGHIAIWIPAPPAFKKCWSIPRLERSLNHPTWECAAGSASSWIA
jgi:hypothetical protein